MKYFCNFECGIILHEKADVQSFISLVLNTHKFEYHDEEFITHSFFFPMLVLAQEEDQSKYMVGAVPEVNGKVVFSQEINAPNLSKDQIFDAILAWANTRFKTDKREIGEWLPIRTRKRDKLLAMETNTLFLLIRLFLWTGQK